MNLVQLANDLEYVPKEQLAEMSQDPNSSYPAYLVLSEIQRRTLNEKNYQAMEQQPTTTVAEEVVGKFMQPQLAQNQSQGLQGGTPQSATPLPDSNISAGLSGVPTAPMQMAASGGITGYANEGKTKLNYSNLRTKLSKDEIKIVNQAVMRDRTQRMQSDLGNKTGKFLGGGANVSEQIFSVLGGGGGNIPIFKGSPEERKFVEVANIILENKNKKASGGLTGYAAGDRTSLDASFQNPYADQRSLAEQGFPNEIDPDQKNMIVERYTDPDGTFAYKRALADGFNAATLAMILAPEPTSSAVGLAARGIAGTGKALYGAIRNPKQTLDKGLEAIGKLKSRRQQGNRFNNPVSSPQSTSNLPTPPGYFKDIGAETLKSAVNPALRIAGATYLGSQLLPDGEETVVKEELTEDQLKIQELERQLAERKNLKGLSGATAEKDNTGNYRDLARLGAGIMSAKNVGDVGETITNIVDAQDKREVQGLQSRYMQIQTEKLEADIAAMPLKELIAAQNSLSASIKAKNESGSISTPEEIIQINKLYEFYSAEIAKRQGFVAETKSAGQDANVIASYG